MIRGIKNIMLAVDKYIPGQPLNRLKKMRYNIRRNIHRKVKNDRLSQIYGRYILTSIYDGLAPKDIHVTTKTINKTFQFSDLFEPETNKILRSIIDYIKPIDFKTCTVKLGPLMNSHIYVKLWEVAYLYRYSGLEHGKRVLIPACGPTYWIPLWHKEVMQCNVSCFDVERFYQDNVIDAEIYRRNNIDFSYQSAADFHYDEKFDAILSHCSIEHFTNGAYIKYLERCHKYLKDGGVLGLATQIWGPACKVLGEDHPEKDMVYFDANMINNIVRSLDNLEYIGSEFKDLQNWQNPNPLEIDAGVYNFRGKKANTICCAFFLKKS